MKSETKQFIRENAVQIYWSLAVLFFAILMIYFNYVLPRSVIPEDLMLPEWEHQISGEKTLSSVPLRKVFGNKRFTNFVKEISIDVINNCDDAFGLNKDSAVVVFSGRMSSMKIIRSAVISALQSKDE